jgi:hypothetical protein
LTLIEKALFLLLLSMTLLFTSSQCRKTKSACDGVVCKKQQECVDGSCFCLTSAYNMGKWCHPKVLGNQHVFYNISQCYGFDTLVLSISKEPIVSTQPNTVAYSIGITTPQYEYPLFTTLIADETTFYAKEAAGDTFFVKRMPYMVATIKGKWCNAVDVSGRMSINKDSLKLKIVWDTADPVTGKYVPIDSCYKVLTK